MDICRSLCAAAKQTCLSLSVVRLWQRDTLTVALLFPIEMTWFIPQLHRPQYQYINYNSHFYANQTTTGQQQQQQQQRANYTHECARIHMKPISDICFIWNDWNTIGITQANRVKPKKKRANKYWGDVKWNMLHEKRMSVERITTK